MFYALLHGNRYKTVETQFTKSMKTRRNFGVQNHSFFFFFFYHISRLFILFTFSNTKNQKQIPCWPERDFRRRAKSALLEFSIDQEHNHCQVERYIVLSP